MMGARSFVAAIVIVVCAATAHAQRGVPQGGFPTWQERLLLVYVTASADGVTGKRADREARLCAPARGGIAEMEDTTPPAIAITAPADGAALTGATTMIITDANDDLGIGAS